MQKWGKGADSIFGPWSQNIKVKGPTSSHPLASQMEMLQKRRWLRSLNGVCEIALVRITFLMGHSAQCWKLTKGTFQ